MPCSTRQLPRLTGLAVASLLAATVATPALAAQTPDKPAYFERVAHDFYSASSAMPGEAAAMVLLALKGKCKDNLDLGALDQTGLEEVFLGGFVAKAGHMTDPAARILYLRGALDGAERATVVDKSVSLDMSGYPLACSVSSTEVAWMQRLADHTPQDRRTYGRRALDDIQKAQEVSKHGPVEPSHPPLATIAEDPKAWYSYYFPDVWKAAPNGFMRYVVVTKGFDRTVQSGHANLMHEFTDAMCAANGFSGQDDRSEVLGYVDDMTEYQTSYRCGATIRTAEDPKVIELAQNLRQARAALAGSMVAAGDYRAKLTFGHLPQVSAYTLVRWAIHDGLAKATPGCKGRTASVTSMRFWLKPDSEAEDAELQLHFGCGRVNVEPTK